MLATIWSRGALAFQLAKRDVFSRYRGSIFGLAWSFFNPLLMLVVYTLFFTEVFQARWGNQGVGKTVYASALFVGLIVHGILAESAVKSAAVIVGNPNLVKKIVFPVEILPWVTVLAAMFHALLSILVLLGMVLLVNGALSPTVLLWPLMVPPIALLCVGIGWILAAGAVYFRDVSQMVGVFVTILLFTSPVFFPAEGLPERFRGIVAFNPLTFPIEQSRDLLLWGRGMNWSAYGRYTACVIVFAVCCHGIFLRVKRGFADVI